MTQSGHAADCRIASAGTTALLDQWDWQAARPFCQIGSPRPYASRSRAAVGKCEPQEPCPPLPLLLRDGDQRLRWSGCLVGLEAASRSTACLALAFPWSAAAL
jgi:hypothetical protein